MRGWRAILLLQIVQRLVGRSPEQQLKQLEALLKAKEDEVAGLRQEIKELEERIARKAPSRKEAVFSAQEASPEPVAAPSGSKPLAVEAGIVSPSPSC
jgi:hypothetical protein